MTQNSWYERYFAKGERVLWKGRPARLFPWTQLDGLAVAGPFIVIWMAWCAAQMPVEEYHIAVVAAVRA